MTRKIFGALAAGALVLAAGVATETVTGHTAGSITLKASALGAPAGASLTFTVVHAGADHVDLSGSAADLTCVSSDDASAAHSIFDSLDDDRRGTRCGDHCGRRDAAAA